MRNPFHDIDARFGLDPMPGGGTPIFLLAAGWRSGSTLLQRLVMSAEKALIWGEPYGRAGLVPSVTRVLQTFQPTWPPDGAFASPDLRREAPESQWIANLYPEPGALRDGLRAMFDTWLQVPAATRGYPRFGLKEVRLSVLDAMALQWIYPDARFVFLVRDPWRCWSSMKGHRWVLRWPDQAVTEVAQFAQVWTGLSRSFLAWDDPAAVRVRFEDLRNPATNLDALEAHLGLRMDLGVRDVTVRGIRKEPSELTPAEIQCIDEVCGPTARALGYAPPLVGV